MGPRKKELPHRTGPLTAIGIDFGTTKCCVGLVRDGKVEILENERGRKTTPSCVAFTEAERLVGDNALDQVALNPTNTVFGAKQLLGRKGEEVETIEGLVRHLPYNVTQERSALRINVVYKGKERKLSPEQIAAMLLSQMKKLAEKHIGCPVQDAVIAVPAHFNNAQRKALKDAGTIAGLNVLGLISETTAAAVAYQDGKNLTTKQNVVVVDIGGGAFNAAVIEVQDASVKVKAICGTPELSGVDLDQLLVEHLAKTFAKSYNVDINGNKRALERLRLTCQKAKHSLTLLPETVGQVDCLIEDIDFNYTIERTVFKNNFLPAAQETIKTILNNVLSIAKLTPSSIDEVVLVGGTTRVPAVQEELVKFFAGKVLNKTVNPDEAVAHGVALQAAMLAGDNAVREVRVVDIVNNPLDYPVELRSNRTTMHYLQIPQKGEEYRVYFQWFYIRKTKDRILLNNIIDSFGIYTPRAVPRLLSKLISSHIDVKKIQSYLTDKDVCDMTREVEQYNKDDEEQRLLICALSELEGLCFKVKGRLTSDYKGDVHQRLKALEYCEDILDWLDLNELSSKEDYESKRTTLQELFDAAEKSMKDNISTYFKRDVNKEKAIRANKRKDEASNKDPSDVKCPERVERTTKPDTGRSGAVAAIRNSSQGRVLTDKSREDGPNRFCVSEHINTDETSEAAPATRAEGTEHTVKKTPTPVVIGQPINVGRPLLDSTGETYATSTQLTHGVQSWLFDYRDPNQTFNVNKTEFKNTIIYIDDEIPVVQDTVCSGGRDGSDPSDGSADCIDMDVVLQGFQNININSKFTQPENSYQKQNNVSCFHSNSNLALTQDNCYSNAFKNQLPDVAPGQAVASQSTEAMEVSAPEYGLHDGVEAMPMNGNCDEDHHQLACHCQQQIECGPPAAFSGDLQQQPLLPNPSGFALPGHHFTDGSAELNQQHHNHNYHQENLGQNSPFIHSGPLLHQLLPAQMFLPQPAHPQQANHIYPTQHQENVHVHDPPSPNSPRNGLVGVNLTNDQILHLERQFVFQAVLEYIDNTREAIKNFDPSTQSTPDIACFVCFLHPYPMEIHKSLMMTHYHRTYCLVHTCSHHRFLVFPPHFP